MINIVNHPWPHTVVDSYYNEDLYKSMREEIISYIKSHGIKQRQTFYISTSPEFAIKFPKTLECSRSVSPYDMLKHFSNHREYRSLSHYTEINIILDGYDYPIHDENPRKILSIVNYVAPEKSTGTLIYDTDKNFVGEVEWKQNRTLIFPGITGKTWHAYNVEPKKLRITLNTFLVNDLA